MRHWKIITPLFLAMAAVIVMLFILERGTAQGPIAGQLRTETTPHQGALPAARAEMYRALLLKSLRTEPYLLPPREDIVRQQLVPNLGHDASEVAIQSAVDDYYAAFHRRNDKHSGANPLALIGRLKAKEMATAAAAEATPALAGNPEVLTVMLNFSGVETYTTDDAVAFGIHCLTDTTYYSPSYQLVIDGPRFNEIAEPIENFLAWLDPATSPTAGFSKEYYELLMYSTSGDTSLMRPDLPNPWTGGNGYDYSGVSFRNYYLENSRGRYSPQGEVLEVTIPKAVSYFGAARCNDDYTDDGFHQRPLYSAAISATEQLNAQFPGADSATNSDFSWADWDKEDVADYDNDGNFLEPDGYVDHFFLIEAGQADAGANEQFLIWPHSGDVNAAAPGVGPTGNQLGGYRVAVDSHHPLGSIWVLNYTVSDENGGLGTLVHEYGHDIGLPDNYGVDNSGPNDGFWDIMSDGVFAGGLLGMQPVHMTIWDKEFLGWNAPVEIDLAAMSTVGLDNGADFVIGQQSKPPTGTIDGLRIDLPDVTTFASVEPYDELMWWSERGDDRNESIARIFTLQVGETATVKARLAYAIEEDYDYFYWEISSTLTGGWVPLDVFSDSVQLTTDADPNGLNTTGNGINGFSPGWIDATATITPAAHAGGTVAFRFRYFTDGGYQEEGIYLDNITISGDLSGPLVADDAEGGDSWSHLSEGFNTTKPWKIHDGSQLSSHYYLVEWRNSGERSGAYGNANTAKAFDIAGFDIGLNRLYWFNKYDETGLAIGSEPFFMHTPGMLVWYVNNRYENNSLDSSLYDLPSDGAKGRVLLADANPYPFTVADPEIGTRLVSDARSAFDGAYTLVDRPGLGLTSYFTSAGAVSTTVIPAATAKPAFHDRIGVAPGTTGELPDNAFFLDAYAGVVLPTVDDVPYWGAWDVYGETGNPGLEAFGINLEVLDEAEDGTWGKVRFWLDDDTIFFDKRASAKSVVAGEVVTYTLDLKDASGTRYDDDFNYTYAATMVDHLPAGATFVPGSLAVIDGPWTITPSTAIIAGETITWSGNLGGNPLHVPDATIQYAVTVNISSGALANTASLHVDPILIDTDTFNEPLELPYYWPKQEVYVASAQVTVGGDGPGQIRLPFIRLRD